MSVKKPRGFTLLEVLIVLAILGLLAVVGVQRLNRTENLKTSIRHLSTVLKKTRAFAKLTGKTYRLVIKKDEKEAHSYWVESSQKMHLIDPKDNEKYKLSMDKEEEAKKDPSGFQPAKDILNQPKRLPNDWEFGRIESSGNPEGDSGDTSYIYFFSQGVSEEAIIQLTNKNKTTWTLHLNAVISQPEIYQEAKTLKDLSQ